MPRCQLVCSLEGRRATTVCRFRARLILVTERQSCLRMLKCFFIDRGAVCMPAAVHLSHLSLNTFKYRLKTLLFTQRRTIHNYASDQSKIRWRNSHNQRHVVGGPLLPYMKYNMADVRHLENWHNVISRPPTAQFTRSLVYRCNMRCWWRSQSKPEVECQYGGHSCSHHRDLQN